MAKCDKFKEALRQSLIDEAKALGDKAPENIDQIIDDKVNSILKRRFDVGNARAIDEVASRPDVLRRARMKEIDKQARNDFIDTFEKTLEDPIYKDSGYTAFDVAMDMMLKTAKFIPHATGYVNADTFADVLATKYEMKTAHLYADLKNMDSPDVARGFFGDPMTPEMDANAYRVGQEIKKVADDLNVESNNFGLGDRQVQPAINMFSINEYIEKNGMDGLRAFLSEHSDNGNDWLDRLMSNHMVHLPNNMLRVKNGASFLAVNAALGGETNFGGAMLKNIYSQARDIGWTKTMGSDASKTIDALIAKHPHKFTVKQQGTLRNYAVASTRGIKTASENTMTKRFFQGLRRLLGASLLGNAGFYTLMDPVNQATWNKVLGLKSNVLSQFNYTNAPRNLKLSAQLYGNTLEDQFTDIMTSYKLIQSRFESSETGIEGGKFFKSLDRLSNLMMRAFGIQKMTQINRAGFQVNAGGQIGSMLKDGTRFGDLNERLQISLRSLGIREAHWDALIAAGDDILHLDRGVHYLDVHQIQDQQLQMQMAGWINVQADTAVMKPNKYDDLALRYMNIEDGSVAHEIMKTVFQFKGFPLAHWRKMLGGMRYMSKQDTTDPRMIYKLYAQYTALSLTAGFGVSQIKNVATGLPDYITGEKEEIAPNPFASIPNAGDALLDAMYIGAVGGIGIEMAMDVMGVKDAIKVGAGGKVYHGKDYAMYGPFFGITAQHSARMLNAMAQGDWDRMGSTGIDYGFNFIPGANFFPIKWMIKGYAREQLKEMVGVAQ